MKLNPWVKIIIGVLFEVVWVSGFNHAGNWWQWALTIVALGTSYYFFFRAGQELPVGTSYAVFVGLGTLAAVIVDSVVFKTPISLIQIALIILLLIGVVGLMLGAEVEPEKTAAKQKINAEVN
ncbi:QacE family quaternary ammonium compound efflux SMR transporter [Periweissella cryptocerci]|uniref:QacE family quaternary ammonium compound efflux SMR transporter n=1 Tax=Periweissella cryptocerci TaxID=2506420 RepID=A0A4V1AIX9_9LACO|nr:SMR family transporter [Periweissella cryptocerci]QBO37065.1 QacE family quaternary ammonium compound efflux SMR transporter [Periweissella cryptocerci]